MTIIGELYFANLLCQKTGINLSKEDNLPQLNNAWDYLMTSMLGGIF